MRAFGSKSLQAGLFDNASALVALALLFGKFLLDFDDFFRNFAKMQFRPCWLSTA